MNPRPTNPKDYLKQVAFAEREIKTLRARLAHYEDLGLTVTSHFTDTPVSHSKGSSRVETAAVGIVDTLSAIQGQIGAYKVIIDDAEKMISKIPQETYRRLLTLRYLAGMSFRSVSDELGYSDRNSVYRAHGWALLELQHVLEEDGIGE